MKIFMKQTPTNLVERGKTWLKIRIQEKLKNTRKSQKMPGHVEILEVLRVAITRRRTLQTYK
ncbi:MAG: hypothetical protein ACLU2J_05500 [Clostridia bacterium]